MIPVLFLRLRRRWGWTVRATGALQAVAGALPFLALAFTLPEARAVERWVLLGLGSTWLLIRVAQAFRRASATDLESIARHLDRTVPELEESAGLLVAPPDPLPPLAELQRRRVLGRLPEIERRPLLPRRSLFVGAGWLAASILAAGLILWLAPGLRAGSSSERGEPGESAAFATKAGAPPLLGKVRVKIIAPDYTGQAVRTVESLGMKGPGIAAPEGSRLEWRIAVDGPVDDVALVIEGESLFLERQAGGEFFAATDLQATRLYYVSLLRAGREVARSEHGRMEALPDLPPDLQVVSPEPFQGIAAEAVSTVELRVEARDDHGLTQAVVVATLAQGSGEQVRFRERRFPFSPEPHGLASTLVQEVDLPGLGLEPGSELYLHVEARDNRQPEPNVSRTETLRIRVPGGAGPSIDLTGGVPILTPPEFLRSQRQIILDTERLLDRRAALSREEFEYRSQLIGDDQSALRLRYGSILGEETEDGSPLGEDHAAGEDGAEGGAADEAQEAEDVLSGQKPDVSSTMEALPSELMHLHDSEESMNFFPDPVRRTFRDMLQQMWSSEGLLRTNRPEEALPHEYEALRLLKSIQEASRTYAQKIGYEPPPLNPEEDRLSGDLSEIPNRIESSPEDRSVTAPGLRMALDRLEDLKQEGDPVPPDTRELLEPMRALLEARALEDSRFDLRALDVTLELLSGRPVVPERIEILQQALWNLLPSPDAAPGTPSAESGSLYRAYRARLESGP